MSKNTNNYNKSYYTTRGVPQPGAENITEEEKQKLAQSEQAAREETTGEDPDIARAMGRKPGGDER